MTRGTVLTSNITGTPAPGKLAYADSASAGNITVEPVAPANSGTLCVGRWASYKDSDGYAKLNVNLPLNNGA